MFVICFNFIFDFQYCMFRACLSVASIFENFWQHTRVALVTVTYCTLYMLVSLVTVTYGTQVSFRTIAYCCRCLWVYRVLACPCYYDFSYACEGFVLAWYCGLRCVHFTTFLISQVFECFSCLTSSLVNVLGPPTWLLVRLLVFLGHWSILWNTDMLCTAFLVIWVSHSFRFWIY